MTSEEVLTRAAEGPDAVVRYAPHADGLAEVYLPPSLGRPDDPARLLVFVHGGFWRQPWDRTHARPLANALIRHGFVVVLPEYRRVGGGGGWPRTCDDVAAALATTPGLVEDVAPGRIDPADPAVVAGHSAGGHLALWAGLRAGSRHVSHVVGLAPVADLVYAAHQHLGSDATQAFMGGEPADLQDAYADADPFSGLAVHHDGEAVHPRITFIHGTADEAVPSTASRAVATRHPRIHYHELDGVDHFALIDPLSDAFATAVLPALTS